MTTARAFIPCGRCGLVIEVTDPDLIPQVGQRPVQVFHETCEGEATPLRRFRVKVQVVELLPPDPERMAAGMTGAEAEELKQRFAQVPPGSTVVMSGGAEVTHIPEEIELTGVSAEAHAETFVAGLPELEKRLGELWSKVREHAPVVDAISGPPEDEPAGVFGSAAPPRLVVP